MLHYRPIKKEEKKQHTERIVYNAEYYVKKLANVEISDNTLYKN